MVPVSPIGTTGKMPRIDSTLRENVKTPACHTCAEVALIHITGYAVQQPVCDEKQNLIIMCNKFPKTINKILKTENEF
jgi:hypothetical protein